GNKPAVLEIGDAAKCRDPESPVAILEEIAYAIIRKPAIEYLASSCTPCLAPLPLCGALAWRAVNRDVPAIPSAQAIKRAKPDAAISGRENRPRSGTRQTLIRGHRADREIAKAIEAGLRRDPDVAFTILE